LSTVRHLGDAVNDADAALEPPKFDLLSYITNYSGRTVFRRLYLIGACCPPLREEAAKMAVREARRGADVRNLYDAVALLKSVPGYQDKEGLLDTTWAVEQQKKNDRETQRLENELKGYKNNLIKESIRVRDQDCKRHVKLI
jgi:COP9 signalosome complex subunit 1